MAILMRDRVFKLGTTEQIHKVAETVLRIAIPTRTRRLLSNAVSCCRDLVSRFSLLPVSLRRVGYDRTLGTRLLLSSWLLSLPLLPMLPAHSPSVHNSLLC